MPFKAITAKRKTQGSRTTTAAATTLLRSTVHRVTAVLCTPGSLLRYLQGIRTTAYYVLRRPCSCLQSSIHYPTVPSVGEASGSLVALERLLET